MLRREVSATQHRLVMVARYLPQNGPKTQNFDFLARMPIKNIFETSFQTSASRLSKWRVRFFWVIFLRLDFTLTMCDKCVFCDVTFSHKSVLEKHVKKIHENIKSYKCNLCEKTFGGRSHFETHVKIVHENIKAYDCNTCNKSFGNKKDLERHVSTIHEGIKAYKCDSCDKDFGYKSNLRRHSNTVHRHQNSQL